MKFGKRLKALRKERKMTLAELSRKSGVQIATLSRMESNIMTGTLDSHVRICKALGISLADFYAEIESASKTASVARVKKEAEPPLRTRKSTLEMLTTGASRKKMMPLLLKIRKGGKTHSEKNKVGTEQFVYVFGGKVIAKVGKEIYKLSKGDSMYFDASLPHALYNNGKSEARLLSVLSPPYY